MIYAAYGSNLYLKQMKERCPNATIFGRGLLLGYHLLFRGRDGMAVATIEPKEGGGVPVLLWEITPCDEDALDQYEGCPSLYRKETIPVQYDNTLIGAMFYVMNEGRPLGKPSETYLFKIMMGYDSASFDLRILQQAIWRSDEEGIST